MNPPLNVPECRPNRAFLGDDQDTRSTGLEPMDLAAGPGGTVLVADSVNGRVHLLSPWIGSWIVHPKQLNFNA